MFVIHQASQSHQTISLRIRRADTDTRSGYLLYLKRKVRMAHDKALFPLRCSFFYLVSDGGKRFFVSHVYLCLQSKRGKSDNLSIWFKLGFLHE